MYILFLVPWEKVHHIRFGIVRAYRTPIQIIACKIMRLWNMPLVFRFEAVILYHHLI